jgi:CDP-glucose 4,6-dehydratase
MGNDAAGARYLSAVRLAVLRSAALPPAPSLAMTGSPASSLPSPAFWQGKRVLVTGHTGFKGGWLTLWLEQLGASVTGVALAPATTPSLFDAARVGARCDSHLADVRDAARLRQLVRDAAPDVVLHLAAQPLVRASYGTPVDTFATNLMGTVHLLEAVRTCATVRVVVCVTTDKVYRNPEDGRPFREEDPLGGHDPYSASKAACEVAVESYRLSFLAPAGVAVASARAGNVIGGGDWAADRLIPDAWRAARAGTPLAVRQAGAVRPWQHVVEPLAGYLVMAERLWDDPSLAGSYNLGPNPDEAATVGEVLALVAPVLGVPGFVETDPAALHEAHWLRLDNRQAAARLGIMPRWSLREALARTAAWYAAYDAWGDAAALCRADLAAYIAR